MFIISFFVFSIMFGIGGEFNKYVLNVWLKLVLCFFLIVRKRCFCFFFTFSKVKGDETFVFCGIR